MAVAVFPQAVLAPTALVALQNIMAEAHGTPFTDGYPNGARPELGNGWLIGSTHTGTLWPSTADALVHLGVPYITVAADHAKLLEWPAVWHIPVKGQTTPVTKWAHLRDAVRADWFSPGTFCHTNMSGHKVLAAEAAGGVLPCFYPKNVHLCPEA